MSTDFGSGRRRIYWYDQYALNEHGRAFSKFDPDRVVEELLAVEADIIAVYAANQFSVAYYPSEIWPQHPGLRGRDYFGDICRRLQAHGKLVIAYVNWLESRHPEWNRVPIGRVDASERHPLASWADPDDPERRVRAVPGGEWQFACRMSPRRDQVLAVAKEIVTRYKPDGFHLDMFHGDPVICVCERCRPSIERICGTTDITDEVIRAHWPAYIDWRCGGTTSLIGELSGYLREQGVFTAHNAAWPMGLSVLYGFCEEWLPHLDIYISELFSDIHSATMTVRWHHALGKPSCELQTSTAPGFAHLSIPRAWWELAAATCKANGCHILGPCGVGAYPDTTTSPELLANVRSGFDAFMADADLQEGSRSAATVALVFSWATRRYFRAGALDWSDAIGGWSHLLIEEHLPFDFVVAESVASSTDLERYDLVVLSDIACVSEAFCAAVQDYVRQGGAIIVTDETSLYDEHGQQRRDFALADVVGCRWRETLTTPFAYDADTEPRPALGVFQAVESSAVVLSRRLETDPAGPVSGMLDPPAAEPSAWPAACSNRFGAGTAVYIAWEPGAAYQRRRMPHFAGFMAGLVAHAMPNSPFASDAPRSVEITLWEQPELSRRIIHLANRTQSPEDLMGVNEVPQLAPFQIRLCGVSPDVQVSGRGAKVRWDLRGDEAVVTVDGMRAYAAVLLTKVWA